MIKGKMNSKETRIRGLMEFCRRPFLLDNFAERRGRGKWGGWEGGLGGQ